MALGVDTNMKTSMRRPTKAISNRLQFGLACHRCLLPSCSPLAGEQTSRHRDSHCPPFADPPTHAPRQLCAPEGHFLCGPCPIDYDMLWNATAGRPLPLHSCGGNRLVLENACKVHALSALQREQPKSIEHLRECPGACQVHTAPLAFSSLRAGHHPIESGLQSSLIIV